MTTNDQVAKILREMALFYEIEGVEFKPRAFERASEGMQSMDQDVSIVFKEKGIKGLEEIAGVGKGIAERIEEFLLNGSIAEYEKYKKKYPIKIEELVRVEGVGPKTVKFLYEKLNVKTLEDLELAARRKKIRSLAGFGRKSEEKILSSIEFLRDSGTRHVLGLVEPAVKSMAERLKNYKHVKKIEIAGSYRRRQETIGDIDILISSPKPKEVMDFFVNLAEVSNVLAKGPTKTMVRLRNGIEADLRIVDEKSFGAALQYFTGDKTHNIELRKIAISKGYKLNEYGLFKGNKLIVGKTEEEIYKKLGLKWMPPEIRTNSGEIEAAQNSKIPKLIEYGSLRGDLQIQTNWTDGNNSIEEMALGAIKRGLSYILITDHTKSLAMTGGADEKQLERQMKEIDKINSKLQKRNPKFKILKGAEVNILRDGSLDINNKTLSKLDVVGVAVHSYFGLTRKEQTQRIIKAIRNPHADILFHTTGRIINRRKAYEVDMEEIIRVAKETGTILEIDAYVDRLDLKDEHIRMCVKAGVKMSISSDAHDVSHMDYLDLGVAQARRGWATKKDIINAWPVEKMLSFLKDSNLKIKVQKSK